jgi:hypothetical protein
MGQRLSKNQSGDKEFQGSAISIKGALDRCYEKLKLMKIQNYQ